MARIVAASASLMTNISRAGDVGYGRQVTPSMPRDDVSVTAVCTASIPILHGSD
jgi:hypothetical protein